MEDRRAELQALMEMMRPDPRIQAMENVVARQRQGMTEPTPMQMFDSRIPKYKDQKEFPGN